MTHHTRKSIAVAATIAILAIAYYGSFLPLRKSQLFIHALRTVGQARSFPEFAEAMSVPLDAPSPIGQEELVRNMGNYLVNIIRGNAQNPELVAAVMQYMERYYAPILARGRGMSYEQNLFVLGTASEFAFIKTNNPQYLAAAKRYYLQGFSLGPNRPQPLYGLLDVYRMEGDLDRAIEMGEKIVSLWPSDERTKGVLEELKGDKRP